MASSSQEAEQYWHDEAPAWLYVPFGHAIHADEPVVLAKVPEGLEVIILALLWWWSSIISYEKYQYVHGDPGVSPAVPTESIKILVLKHSSRE